MTDVPYKKKTQNMDCECSTRLCGARSVSPQLYCFTYKHCIANAAINHHRVLVTVLIMLYEGCNHVCAVSQLVIINVIHWVLS